MKNHFEFFEGLDAQLEAEDRLLDELKQAVAHNGLEEATAEQVMSDFHYQYPQLPRTNWDVV